jgi:hypothetical protein
MHDGSSLSVDPDFQIWRTTADGEKLPVYEQGGEGKAPLPQDKLKDCGAIFIAQRQRYLLIANAIQHEIEARIKSGWRCDLTAWPHHLGQCHQELGQIASIAAPILLRYWDEACRLIHHDVAIFRFDPAAPEIIGWDSTQINKSIPLIRDHSSLGQTFFQAWTALETARDNFAKAREALDLESGN